MKINLFSRFRNLFRRAEPDYEDDYEEGYENYSDVVVEEATQGEDSLESGTSPVPVGNVLQMPQGAGVPGQSETDAQGIYVPLAPIVANLPLELQSRVFQDVGDLSVYLPLDRILPQLSKGVVTLAFFELRQAAPEIFGGNREHDEVPVNVPLSAILPQVGPDMLTRKHGPLQMDIPEDIVSPFADRGKGLAIGSVRASTSQSPFPTRSKTPPTTVPRTQPPTTPHQAAPPVKPSLPTPNLPPPPPSIPTVQPAAPPKPVSAIGTGSPPTALTPRPPLAAPGATNQGTTILRKPPGQPPAQPPVPTPARPPIPTPTQQPVPTQVQQPQGGTLVAAAADSQTPLQIAISAVAGGWPDSLKQEIIQVNLAQAKLAIPYQLVEGGLKRGRLSFTWRQLKTFLVPSVSPQVSLHDNAELELPLRVVAPLFIAQQKQRAQESTKVAVDKDIPNLFFGLPQPDTAGVAVDHSVTRPVDTNYYVWDDRDEMVATESKAGWARQATAATEFVTRYATPNEVVSRAAALEGVEGAVIALPDGLLVASQLPPGLNGDTLAAFLPQLFGKVTQCTQELRMGELNNLNFTVGNIPWKVFRVNALYFAAFGVKGEPLPTAKLAALAGELDHKAKTQQVKA